MQVFELNDKRSKNGTLLRYETCKIADDIANKCIQEIKLLESYRILSSEFNSKKIELYFKKYFYDEVYDWLTKLVWFIGMKETMSR